MERKLFPSTVAKGNVCGSLVPTHSKPKKGNASRLASLFLLVKQVKLVNSNQLKKEGIEAIM